MTDADERALFAARLNELCVDMHMPERGRQTQLAAKFGVTPKGARKWLTGAGLPELQVIIAIAKWAQVNFEWMITGRGPKRGNLVDTTDLVVGEMMRKLPPLARHEVADFVGYKIERSVPSIAMEDRARYLKALDLVKGDPL